MGPSEGSCKTCPRNEEPICQWSTGCLYPVSAQGWSQLGRSLIYCNLGREIWLLLVSSVQVSGLYFSPTLLFHQIWFESIIIWPGQTKLRLETWADIVEVFRLETPRNNTTPCSGALLPSSGLLAHGHSVTWWSCLVAAFIPTVTTLALAVTTGLLPRP